MTGEEQALDRARRAKSVLGDATVMEAFDTIAEQLTAQWRHTTSGMIQPRETLYAQVAGLDALKAQLAAWIDQGKAVEIKRERETKRRR